MYMITQIDVLIAESKDVGCGGESASVAKRVSVVGMWDVCVAFTLYRRRTDLPLPTDNVNSSRNS